MARRYCAPMPRLLVLNLLVIATATAAVAQTARVVDGDTIELAGERIRLWGKIISCSERRCLSR